MPQPPIFIQECPVCGRPLEIRREYQGKKLACPQCGGRFTAIDPARHPWDIWNNSNRMLYKADELLETCAAYGTAIN
ncbi:MAG TPA: hypothetical protein VIH42_07810 [Thermoguttaceae bacterium]